MTDAQLSDAIGQFLTHSGPYGFWLVFGGLVARELRRFLLDAHKLFKDCTPTIIVKVDGPVPVYLVPHPEGAKDDGKEAAVDALVEAVERVKRERTGEAA